MSIPILSILLAIAVVALVLWAASSLLAVSRIPEPVRTVIWVAIVVICLLALLGAVFGGGPILRLS